MESSWWSNVMFIHGSSATFKPARKLKISRVMLRTAGHPHCQGNNSPAAEQWLRSDETRADAHVHPSFTPKLTFRSTKKRLFCCISKFQLGPGGLAVLKYQEVFSVFAGLNDLLPKTLMTTQNHRHLELVVLLVTEPEGTAVGNFKEKYVEMEPLGWEEVLTLLVPAPSSACPLPRAQQHMRLSFRATFLLQCLLKSIQWLFGFSPLSFYEEI